MGSEPGMAGGHPGPQWWWWGQRGAWGLSLLVGGWCEQGLSPLPPLAEDKLAGPAWGSEAWVSVGLHRMQGDGALTPGVYTTYQPQPPPLPPAASLQLTGEPGGLRCPGPRATPGPPARITPRGRPGQEGPRAALGLSQAGVMPPSP